MGSFFTTCQRDPFKPVKPAPISPTAQRRAVIIGINYLGQPEVLQSCVNDALTMRTFIKSKGFRDHEITLLIETSTDRRTLPTRRNILQALTWLVAGARTGDSLFFYFAGHGSQVPDLDGDEDDGLDETILPMDWKKSGYILDDDLFLTIVKPLPHGCRLTAVMDCCHSGTGLDLPFGLKGTHNSKNFLTRQRSTTMVPITSVIKKSDGDVILFSGCCDDETSMDNDDSHEIAATASYARYSSERMKRRGQRRSTRSETDSHLSSASGGKGQGMISPRVSSSFGLFCCVGGEGDPPFGLGKYEDNGDYIKLHGYCNDCDEPTSIFCKVTGRKHVVSPDKGRQVNLSGRAGGALTTAFTTILSENNKVQLVDLVISIRRTLTMMNFEQIVQISGSKPFKMNSTFEI